MEAKSIKGNPAVKIKIDFREIFTDSFNPNIAFPLFSNKQYRNTTAKFLVKLKF